MNVLAVYNELLAKYGPQGWWPHHGGRKRPGFDYKFEIIVGAVLTQNTAWTNVEKAIECLFKKNLLDAQSIAAVSIKRLETCIKSSGYYRQKAKKLKIVAKFFLENKKSFTPSLHHLTTLRLKLLDLWGIGRETADSILLYAFNQPVFVIDAYTRRLLKSRGHKKLFMADYDELRQYFERRLPQDAKLFNEYHALIVKWGKVVGKGSSIGCNDMLETE
jgi:endonuclease-3 related protein